MDERFLVSPRIVAELDPRFQPAALRTRAFLKSVEASGGAQPLHLALEQSDGSISCLSTSIFAPDHSLAGSNCGHVERLLKFMLWSRGGHRVYLDGPESLAEELRGHYRDSEAGRFDSEMMGERIYGRPFEVVSTRDVPEPKSVTAPLGRHLEGCRIGFDLGGSDRKVAAVIDGKAVFSEETVWNPVKAADPQYHFDGIMDSLKKAAAHLPRVDAIGGSAAGVYVGNRVRVASLFRSVPPDLFATRVKNLFFELREAWNNVPFEVVNDGEVTALAGSMSLKDNAVLGIAMGTSMAAGYVNAEGNITSWLNELAFVPVDFQSGAPVDEWSADTGCGVQYFSQQAVARLLAGAGIDLDPEMAFPEKLKEVQRLMVENDPRAARIYKTIGTYLGYSIGHFADFYEIRHLLVLGRVTTGTGGDLILDGARKVLDSEFPRVAEQLRFHVPDETEKRHGQAIAAASLPTLPG